MKVPEIIKNSIAVLKQVTDNVDDLALLNVLNSKVANLVTLKGATFKQYSNSSPRTLSYYGINFMHSGANKDYTVDCINDYLMSFVRPLLEKRIEDFKQNYIEEHEQFVDSKKEQDKIDEFIKNIRVSNFELLNPNYTGLYKEAEQIQKIGFGGLFIRIGELGDYLDAIVTGNAQKKELYQKLKDIYEGTVAPSIVAGDGQRKTLKNIPLQVLMYTDFENLYNEKVKQYYINSLKTGMARRCFIYIPHYENPYLNYPKTPEQKEQAFYQANKIEQEYKHIFEQITEKQVYLISEEAKQYLYDYQCKCIDYFNTSKDNIIVKLERKESFWKITKLAVIYSIVDNPLNTIVSTKYVQMAEDFYNNISRSLADVIEKRKATEIEQIADYMVKNADNPITRTELRKTNIVNGNKFKMFFDNHLEEIREEIRLQGYEMYEYNGDKNSKGYQLIKVKSKD